MCCKLILDEIIEYKRHEVEKQKKSVGRIDETALQCSDRDFANAIRRAENELPKVIAEVKKASPSKGIIRSDFEPVKIALSYENAGAAAISVLTDEKFFQGHLEYLKACREAVSLPALRKDFIIDEFQILESRASGADAMLLIAAVLDTDELKQFRETAESLGMAGLVEVHDEDELRKAVQSEARIIGINNRDLRTFEVDINTTLKLAKAAPKDVILVSESGISNKNDLYRLADAGIDAVLIGEALMRADDPGAALRGLTAK